jgi:hypothetical protein
MTQRAKEMPLPFHSNGQDGRYDHTKPSEQLPDWSYTRPWATNEERLTSQALSSALMDAPTVQDTIRPPLPQVNPFPPRYGYRSRQLGIDDIVDINEIYNTPVANNFGGGISGGMQGTTRNSQGTGSW